MNDILLGAIADDFTGATDLANTLVKQGMRTIQVIGIPDDTACVADADAVVVALKSRTTATQEAIDQSLQALDWLQRKGARQILFKYCSTFDSTNEGNIGPVADALLDATGSHLAVVCPAFPATGRTIYQGHLYVGDQPLDESPMKDHPLTPMQDSSLVRLMAAQSEKQVGLIPYSVIAKGSEAIESALDAQAGGGSSYVVCDAIFDHDLFEIGKALRTRALVTGGSGIALGLPENFRQLGLLGDAAQAALPDNAGRAAALAGSCSVATREQVAFARQHFPALKLNPDQMASGTDTVDEALSWADQQPSGTPVLIYASAGPDEVEAVQQRFGREQAGAMIENTFAGIAKGLVSRGVGKIIVAGGETSGAVVSALGIHALRIGPEIDPGVPWTESIGATQIALALKSGNFGTEDFFVKAVGMLE